MENRNLKRSIFGATSKYNQIRVGGPPGTARYRYAVQADDSKSKYAAAGVILSLPIVAAVAAFFLNQNTGSKGCVDQFGVVVENAKCLQTTSSGGSYYPYRWHYGGRRYSIGSIPSGGSYTPPPIHSSGTTRGLFGNIGHGFSFGS